MPINKQLSQTTIIYPTNWQISSRFVIWLQNMTVRHPNSYKNWKKLTNTNPVMHLLCFPWGYSLIDNQPLKKPKCHFFACFFSTITRNVFSPTRVNMHFLPTLRSWALENLDHPFWNLALSFRIKNRTCHFLPSESSNMTYRFETSPFSKQNDTGMVCVQVRESKPEYCPWENGDNIDCGKIEPVSNWTWFYSCG